MLTHKIIIHKPKVEYTPPSYLGSSATTYPSNVHYGAWQPKVRTQEELDEYLRRLVIAEDTYIISKNWAADVKLKLYRVHYVLYVETQLMKVPAFELGHPKCFYMVQVDGATDTPWMRWSTAEGYRVLTPEEHKELIEPQHDYVQNRIQEFRQATTHIRGTTKEPSPY